jgi:hypothetical protein
MKILKNKLIRDLIITVVGGLVVVAIDRAFPGINLLGFLWHLLLSILRLRIPDIIFAVVVLGIIVVLVLHNKRFKGLSLGEFQTLKSDNERMQAHNNQLVKTFNDSVKKNEELYAEFSGIEEHYKELTALDFKDNLYWVMKDGKVVEGPFCPRCRDDGAKRVHMISGLDPKWYKCPACDTRILRPEWAAKWL